MESNVYIYLLVSHQTFTTGKSIIISVPSRSIYLDEYAQVAKKKVCEKLGFKESDLKLLDYRFFGDLTIID